MRATGILNAGILSPASQSQKQLWQGVDDCSFLGGFGSDFCSGDIEDVTRIYKDRGEQICIAYNRAKEILKENERIVRVVHIGDAPSDILAAKMCYEELRFGVDVTVGCVAVATGKFSSSALNEFVGVTEKGKWEPVVLEHGLADPEFIKSCGIITVALSSVE